MQVHPEPEPNQEASILCPNAPSDAQQEDPVYTEVFGLFMPASSHLPESVKQCEWQQRNKKLLISPQTRAAKQTQCRPRVDLWLLCVSDDSAALSFTAKTRWMLIIGYENWEVILRLTWELELSDNFWIKEDFRSMRCCVLITEWKT